MKIVTEIKTVYRSLGSRFKVLAWMCLISASLWVPLIVLSLVLYFSGFHISMTTDFTNGVGLIWEIAGLGAYLTLGVFAISSLVILDHLNDRYKAKLYNLK